MTTDTRQMTELAEEARGWFEQAARLSADPATDGDRFWRLRDGHPEWVAELVHKAHGEFLPDDWRYESIVYALDFITETEGDAEDASVEYADSRVDVYTSARLAWLGSNLNRVQYVNDAVENFGHSTDGVLGDIGAGQYEEAGEVFALVLAALEDRAGES